MSIQTSESHGQNEQLAAIGGQNILFSRWLSMMLCSVLTGGRSDIDQRPHYRSVKTCRDRDDCVFVNNRTERLARPTQFEGTHRRLAGFVDAARLSVVNR